MESEKEVCDGEQAANAPQIKHELEGDVFYDAVEDETRSVPAQKNDPPDPDAIEATTLTVDVVTVLPDASVILITG